MSSRLVRLTNMDSAASSFSGGSISLSKGEMLAIMSGSVKRVAEDVTSRWKKSRRPAGWSGGSRLRGCGR